MSKAVIIASTRTPVGKYGGCLAPLKDWQLGSAIMKEVVTRSGISGEEIDDIYMGNLLGLPGNVARVAALDAGIPPSVPAVTLDRQCASSLEALGIASAMIEAGRGEVYLTGGCESMSNRPYLLEKPSRAYAFNPPSFVDALFVPPSMKQLSMGETAEKVLELYPFSRVELDSFALESHQKALEAQKAKRFDGQITPLEIPGRKGSIRIDQDESPRQDSSLEKLGSLPALFRKDGKVTAGNSCPMSDGAAAQILCSAEKAASIGKKPMAVIEACVSVGLDYKTMGLGPILAVRKLLKQQKIPLEEIGLIELNEAFSSQSLACIKELNLDPEKVNVNGGALSLGHPLGATGSILVTKLLYAMEQRDVEYGLVTLCIGGGQGTALLLKRENR